jgi:GT2 family glycosyltransferase
MLDIVIVNWNAGEQLYHLIESIEEFHSQLVTSVVIVDNASRDFSVDPIETNFKNTPFNIKIIRNKINVGFGSACNQGAAVCTSKYLLFLNPDALLYKDTLTIATDYMDTPEQSDVGICGIQLIDEHNAVSRSCARFPTPLSFFIHSVGLNRLKIFASQSLHMHDWDHMTTQTVDHVIGAFYLVRNSLFKSLNGFDERYFVYLEDLDFSYRANLAGYRSVYLTEAKSFHEGGGTSNQVKATRLFYSLRSRLLYADKHFSKIGSIIVLMATMIIEPVFRILYAALLRSKSQIAETLDGYRMLFTWLPKWMFKGETR